MQSSAEPPQKQLQPRRRTAAPRLRGSRFFWEMENFFGGNVVDNSGNWAK